MDQLAVPIGGLGTVIGTRTYSVRLDVASVEKEGGTIEGGAQAGHHRGLDVRGGRVEDERAGRTAEDVRSRRLCERPTRAAVGRAGEEVAADGARNVAHLPGLAVDDQGLTGVGGPDLVDVGCPVVRKGIRGSVDVVGGSQDVVGSSVGVGDAELVPGVPIRRRLRCQVRAERLDGVRLQAGGRLRSDVRARQGDFQVHADEVDVGGVRIDDAIRRVREFHKAPGGGVLRGPGNRRLDQSRACGGQDDRKLQAPLSEPYSAPGNVGRHCQVC